MKEGMRAKQVLKMKGQMRAIERIKMNWYLRPMLMGDEDEA